MDQKDLKGRNVLFTHPRTASNLLMRMLNLEEQPNVLPVQMGGYFFLEVNMASFLKNIRTKPMKEWTEEEHSFIKQGFQAGFDKMDQHFNTARVQNKTVFFKEHVMCLTDPSEQSRIMFGSESTTEPRWAVELPEHYQQDPGPPCTGSNNTLLPDAFLRSVRPLFLIRHPALVFASDLRTIKDLPFRRDALASYTGRRVDGAPESVVQSFELIRALYDWYMDQLGTAPAAVNGSIPNGVNHDNDASPLEEDGVSWPVVIEADDLMTEPKVLVRLCNILGLDPAKCKAEWPVRTAEDLADSSEIYRRMLSTLNESSRIIAGKSAVGLDIDEEAKKWKGEFGEEDAVKLERAVRGAMPAYEYMRARRLRSH